MIMINKQKPPQSFEQAMQELDGIVTQMESGELPLQDMLSAYKRGAELSRYCRDQLNNAQMEIKKLNKNELLDCSDEHE